MSEVLHHLYWLAKGVRSNPSNPSPTRLIGGHQNKRSALRLCQPKFEKKFVHFSNILIGSVTRVAGKFITWTSFTSSLKLQLCTYQCKSCGEWGGVRARGGDLMPETIPLSGVWSCQGTPGSGHLTLTDRSLVSIQKRLPSPSLEAFWKSRCWRKVWSFHLF